MKHAGPLALAELEPLLSRLRGHPGLGLVERTPGSFYRRSKAWLHFHEDPAGLFADVKLDGAVFTRMRITTQDEQHRFLACIDSAVAR